MVLISIQFRTHLSNDEINRFTASLPHAINTRVRTRLRGKYTKLCARSRYSLVLEELLQDAAIARRLRTKDARGQNNLFGASS